MPSQFRKLHPYRHFISWLLSVAAVGFIGMWLFNVIATSEAGTSTSAPEKSKHATADAATLSRAIKTRLENTFSNNTNLTFALGKSSVPFKVSSSDYYVKPIDAPAAIVSWDQSLGDEYSLYIRTRLQEAAKEIMQNNLELRQFNNGTAATLSYQNDTAMCIADLINKDEATTRYAITCLDTTEYQSLVNSIAPFAALYSTARPSEITQTTTYEQLKVTDSTVPGYKRASLTVSQYDAASGAELLFYKVGESDWQFFTATQQALQCSEYTTEPIRNAFKGKDCIDDESSELRKL